jgi:hypothetical protein
MANSNIDIARDLRDKIDELYKDIQSKFDEYHKTNLKLSLIKGKYGNGQLNEHQQREIDSLATDIQEIKAEIESEISPFNAQVMPLVKELYTFDGSVVSKSMIDDVVTLLGFLNKSQIENLDEVSRELTLASAVLVKQYQSDESRSPRAFAKKPTAGEEDLDKSQGVIAKIAEILGFITKAEEGFRNRIGLMSKPRLEAFYKIESQRLELLVSIIPQLKSVYQYLKSDSIDPNKLNDLMGEVIAVMQKADQLPYMDIPIYMSSGITQLFNFSWLDYTIDGMVSNLKNGTYQKILTNITTALQWIEHIQKNGISEANKINDNYLEQIIAENQSNIEYFSKAIDDFFNNNKAMTASMPKTLYDDVNQTHNPPTVSGKDEDKIWADYKLWYDKLEENIRDLIDFVKMYHSIKSLYPFTIALRTVDKRGRDVDNQAYVRSMQTLLNEALDSSRPMPTRKKSLVAKLFNYYPADERIAKAYYRVFGVENV